MCLNINHNGNGVKFHTITGNFVTKIEIFDHFPRLMAKNNGFLPPFFRTVFE